MMGPSPTPSYDSRHVYHILLTSRYLTSRIIPLLAIAAVAKCVATGDRRGIGDDRVPGHGQRFRSDTHDDVVVSYPVNGIPWYEDLIEEIEALPDAEAAAPMVETIGVLRMPYPRGASKEPKMVQIWGIDGERLAKVTTYEETLMWSRIPEPARPYVELDRVYQPIIESLDRDQRIEILRVSPWENTDAMSDSQVSDLTVCHHESRMDRTHPLCPDQFTRDPPPFISTDQIKLMQTALAAEEDMPPLQDQVLGRAFSVRCETDSLA